MPADKDKVIRKLRAILSADVKGYSLLMTDDEIHTIQTLKAYRQIMSDLIMQHSGRVIDSPGDNLLAEFGSAVDALECAVYIQKRLKKENARFVDDKRLQFRIGVNIGDVIQDGDRIYGSGVNIAARIEGLADPGGICISRNTYDQVKDKLQIGYEYLGEHEVKNIKEPVRLYKVLLDSDPPATLIDEPLELPDKPSIAVLPFVNMSGDPSQEYFSDGITEDLITDLSKVSELFVIARNSAFTFKNKTVKVQDVGKELRVRFILEGSIRKVGNRVRINAQLIDAISGGHLWAERYDRDLVDIFDLQDEVTQKIVAALTLNLTKSEEKQLAHRSTENLKAYDCVLRGMKEYWKYTKEGNSQAQVLFRKAIELDPYYAEAYSWLGLSLLHSWTQAWNKEPQILDRAYQIAKQALTLNDSLSEAHRILGDIYLYQKEHAKAALELKEAISLNPNYADALAGLADVLNWAGKPEDAISLIKKAMHLNPHHNAWYPYTLGFSYIFLQQIEKAVDILQRGLIHNPDFLAIHLALAGLYADMDRIEDANMEVEEVLRLSPDFTLQVLQEMIPLKDPVVKERLINAARKAGLPE